MLKSKQRKLDPTSLAKMLENFKKAFQNHTPEHNLTPLTEILKNFMKAFQDHIIEHQLLNDQKISSAPFNFDKISEHTDKDEDIIKCAWNMLLYGNELLNKYKKGKSSQISTKLFSELIQPSKIKNLKNNWKTFSHKGIIPKMRNKKAYMLITIFQEEFVNKVIKQYGEIFSQFDRAYLNSMANSLKRNLIISGAKVIQNIVKSKNEPSLHEYIDFVFNILINLQTKELTEQIWKKTNLWLQTYTAVLNTFDELNHEEFLLYIRSITINGLITQISELAEKCIPEKQKSDKKNLQKQETTPNIEIKRVNLMQKLTKFWEKMSDHNTIIYSESWGFHKKGNTECYAIPNLEQFQSKKYQDEDSKKKDIKKILTNAQTWDSIKILIGGFAIILQLNKKELDLGFFKEYITTMQKTIKEKPEFTEFLDKTNEVLETLKNNYFDKNANKNETNQNNDMQVKIQFIITSNQELIKTISKLNISKPLKQQGYFCAQKSMTAKLMNICNDTCYPRANNKENTDKENEQTPNQALINLLTIWHDLNTTTDIIENTNQNAKKYTQHLRRHADKFFTQSLRDLAYLHNINKMNLQEGILGITKQIQHLVEELKTNHKSMVLITNLLNSFNCEMIYNIVQNDDCSIKEKIEFLQTMTNGFTASSDKITYFFDEGKENRSYQMK